MIALLFLIFILLIIFICNLFISKNDLFNPGCIITMMFLASSILAMNATIEHNLSLHFNTILVIISAPLIFLLINVYMYFLDKNNYIAERKIVYINVNKVIIIIVIVCQVIQVITWIKYVYAVVGSSISVVGGNNTLAETLGTYDSITKFSDENIVVNQSVLARIVSPVTAGIPFIFIYILINNFLVCKKVDILMTISLALTLLNQYLSGSRGPLMMTLLMVISIYYFLRSRDHKKRKRRLRFYLKIMLVLVLAIAIIYVSISIFGRENKLTLYDYLFVYISGSLYNLDLFLNSNTVYLKGYFCRATLKNLYNYLFTHNLLADDNVKMYIFHGYHGYNFGNVYTMYMPYIKDLGLFGLITLDILMAIFYIVLYRKIFMTKCTGKIMMDVFYYSYFMYQIVMSIFDAYFFSVLISPNFLKVVVTNWLFVSIFIDKKFHLGNKHVKLKNKV